MFLYAPSRTLGRRLRHQIVHSHVSVNGGKVASDRLREDTDGVATCPVTVTVGRSTPSGSLKYLDAGGAVGFTCHQIFFSSL